MRFTLSWFALLVSLALIVSCQRTPDAQPSVALPTLPSRAPDPLAAVAKALPAGKVQLELTHAGPAGTTGEECAYEWTILAQAPTSKMAIPKGLGFPGHNPDDPWWTVCRLTITARFEKSGQDQTSGKSESTAPKPSQRSANVQVKFQFANPAGSAATSPGSLMPGTPLTLQFANWRGPNLKGQFETLPFPNQAMVTGSSLDNLVKPLFKGKELVDLQKPLPLLEVGGKVTTLELQP